MSRSILNLVNIFMQLINGLQEIKAPFANAVVAIGNFDGVHRGHQTIFHTVAQKAATMDGTSVAITFDPHPVTILKNNGSPPLITIMEQKIELIEQAGIDVLICIPFDQAFASLSAREFVDDILIARIGMKAIVIGKDYAFGKNRKGNVAFLNACAAEKDFEVIVTDWIDIADDTTGRVSSTRIRELIQAGEVVVARKMLGRHYQLRGVVVRGRNRGGRLLGFPTANITFQDELCPKTGVYAVTVETLSETFAGVANIGYSPTFDDHLFTVEVHLLDFKGDLYDQKIRVNFIERIRDEKKFSHIDELSRQITTDIQTAGRILTGMGR